MPGLVPGIHVFDTATAAAWMAGTSPAMRTPGQVTNRSEAFSATIEQKISGRSQRLLWLA
ncbi:hypothetical protein [Rhodoplanes sp. SY1]|uniref:hypothetical protein n=1 Tax=Rhodoplanes sp. SY1 TaxID=3166646 RepID=UPI0038B46172